MSSHTASNGNENLPRVPPYQALARKYRPRDFNSLIGQEAMVKTLKNAFLTGRIAHAWILTGVRGVGKTTTARILARALNYKTSEINKPSADFPLEGEHCRSILEGRHVDVMEIDAASHTSIDDVREIIEGARYAPACARFKVYIIDEVHMLSTQAFNGLLKTLEEPPQQVKFILATTEIRKIPVTILSRCQRFDLRRIDSRLIKDALADISRLEKIEAEEEALAIIARAAGGSMRDAQSMLDQAILHGEGLIRADSVRKMLGVVDRSSIMDMFENIMKGDIAAVLKQFDASYVSGADPVSILTDLAEITHLTIRTGLVGDSQNDISYSVMEYERSRSWSQALSVSVLSRTWQMLLKAIEEIKEAPDPCIAGEMALIRLTHVVDLPTLDQAIEKLEETLSDRSFVQTSRISDSLASLSLSNNNEYLPPASDKKDFHIKKATEKVLIRSLRDIVDLAESNRDMKFKVELKEYVRLVDIGDHRLEIDLTPDAPPQLIVDLKNRLKCWTNNDWEVVVSLKQGAPTLKEEEIKKRNETMIKAENSPVIAKVLESFPGAQIVDIRTPDSSKPDGSDYSGLNGDE